MGVGGVGCFGTFSHDDQQKFRTFCTSSGFWLSKSSYPTCPLRFSDSFDLKFPFIIFVFQKYFPQSPIDFER